MLSEHPIWIDLPTRKTGEVLHTMELSDDPAGTPMTYMMNGKQYIVVATGGKKEPAKLVALALAGE
jgi:quinoprotein glucose dehydrogenase